MLAHKTYRTLIAWLLTCMLVVSVAGCGGSGSGGQTGSESPSTATFVDLKAIPGPMVAVRVGQVATLDGSGSAITSTESLSYNWSFAHKPYGSITVLQGATTATPSFIADVRGVYTLQLLVSIEGATSQRGVAIVIVTNDGESLIGPFPGHQGVSSNCVGCHDGVNRTGTGEFIKPKTPNHVATSNTCQACHTPQGLNILPYVDHLEIFGNCSECHDGVIAIGKSEFHTPTNSECSDCHNTTSFLPLAPDGSFDHSNIVRACAGCHNGTVAIGKTDTVIHQNTSSDCSSCHTTVSFVGGYPDHTGPDVVGAGISCDSCHGVPDGFGGLIAKGQSVGHPVITSVDVDCSSCHSIVSFKMPGGIFNHALLDATDQSCESCHNDSTSINAPAKSSALNHPVTSADCGSCHNTEYFKPAFDYNHDGIVANCQTCHGNNSPVPPQVTATGKPLATPVYAHMPTNPDNPGTASDQDCGDCHTPGTFSTGTYDHFGVVNNCNACHNNVIGVGQLPNHIPTVLNQDCADCHNTTDFADVTFDHTTTNTSNCLACHDGNISKGKSVGHVSTVLNCSTCHLVAGNNYTTFAGTFNHAPSVVNNSCASCHNTGIATPKKVDHIPAQTECSQCHTDTTITGGFSSAALFTNVHSLITSGCEGCHSGQFSTNSGNLNGKPVNHLPTAQDCDVCHTSSINFGMQNFNHTGITGNCVSCHDGNYVTPAGALGKSPSPTHDATTSDCGACHAIGNNFTDGAFDHTGVVSNCASCHGDNPTTTPVGPKKNPGHLPTTQDCSFCHVPGTFTPAVFDHTGIDNNCASCHGDASTAAVTKMNVGHVATTQDCSVCHNTTAFAGATFDHQGITDNCASCHDGATARGKTPPPNHVPTTQDCSMCHQTTGFIPGTFDHTGIVDNCRSCHDGAYAKGKTDTHVATNQDCGVCHTTSLPLSFTGAVFDHTGIVDNCVSCHDGGTAMGKDAKTNPAHIATSLDCHFCHTTATFVGGTWVHDASTVNNCNACHIENGAAKTYKLPGHLVTNEQCDVCHTTTSWAPSNFKHSAQGNYPGKHRRDPGCTGCHKVSIGGGINIGNYPNQLKYAPFCAGCHAKDFDPKDKHIGGENGTIEQNKNCAASGCHSVFSSEF